MDEAYSYLKEFILDQEVHYPEEGKFDYVDFIKYFENIQLFDRPDFYSVSYKTIYIYEHFEVDASRASRKKGSRSRIDIERDNHQYEEWIKKNKSTYYGQLKTELSFEYYLNNLKINFNNHYKKIEDYKKNICMKLKINKDEYTFKIVFIIEDKTMFGTAFFDKEKGPKIVFPIFTNEFLDFIKDKFFVDNIICSVETSGNIKYTWLFSRIDEAYFRSNAYNLLEHKIINLNPISIGC